MSQSSEITAQESASGTAGNGRQDVVNPLPVRRSPKFLLLLPPALIVALVLGVYIHGIGYESTDDAFIEGHVSQVSARVSGHIQKINVDDNQMVKAGDKLLELDPRDYQVRLDQARAALAAVEAKVEAAQINVTLTSGTTSAGVEQASSGVDLARSALETSRAQVASAQSMKRQAEAQFTAAQADASEEQANARAAEAEETQARADLERAQKLVGDGAISRQQLDHAVTTEHSARAKAESARQKAASMEASVTAARAAVQTSSQNLAEAQTQVAQAQARIGEAGGRLNAANTAPHQVAVTQAQLKGLNAELAQARAAVHQAELDLEYTTVRAPETGRVTHKTAEVGNFIQTGQSVLAIVSPQVWVVANFKETQLTRMRPGQPATIKVDSYPAVEFKGRVDSVQAGTGARFSLLPPENATGNYVKVVQRVPVKIVMDALPGGDYLLAPGMSVEPRVRVK